MKKAFFNDDKRGPVIAAPCSCDSNNPSRREFLKKAALGAGALGVAFEYPWAEAAEKPDAPKAQPPVPIPDVSIHMRSLDAYLVGVSTSEVIEIKLVDVLKFHGYCAGGVAFAFRAAQEAFKLLFGNELPVRQSMKVQTAHHCCQAGALAYITGARTDFGAERSVGDLVLIPKETKKIVFTHKKTGKQVTLRPLFDPHDTFVPLFRGVINDQATAPKVRQVLRDAVQEYINAPVERLFQIDQA